MAGFLIGEEGALSGLIIELQDAHEWILGRDPDVCYQVLEDPMVSRKHVLIREESPHQLIIENLSATNPASINGEPLLEPYELSDQDLIQIGSTLFRFTTTAPDQKKPEPPLALPSSSEDPFSDLLSFKPTEQSRWLLKVTLGPNTGAEFPLEYGKSYTLGKDPALSDLVFQDLSVSRKHARLTLTESGELFIEDLGSRNGVLVNGSLIEEKTPLFSQDAIAIGTTTFVVIDRIQERETVYAAAITETSRLSEKEKEALLQKEAEIQQQLTTKKDWKETFIPNRHLAIGFLFLFVIVSSFVGIVSLFHEEPVQVAQYQEDEEIERILKDFPAVTFNFDGTTGSLFLVGHVLTDVSYQKLNYLLKTLPFVRKIEDNVIIDEYVWQNVNALLFKNPNFRSVLVSGAEPGRFILRGFVQTPQELINLDDYVNMNFPYLDRLTNQVVVEDNLITKIQSQLITQGFLNVTFQLANSQIVFSGRIGEKEQKNFSSFLKDVEQIQGIREVRNFVILTQEQSSRIDLTSRYTVSGTSKMGNTNQFVLINGRILSVGDNLDGMQIQEINPDSVFLDKDGMKYKIDYNFP